MTGTFTPLEEVRGGERRVVLYCISYIGICVSSTLSTINFN